MKSKRPLVDSDKGRCLLPVLSLLMTCRILKPSVSRPFDCFAHRDWLAVCSKFRISATEGEDCNLDELPSALECNGDDIHDCASLGAVRFWESRWDEFHGNDCIGSRRSTLSDDNAVYIEDASGDRILTSGESTKRDDLTGFGLSTATRLLLGLSSRLDAARSRCLVSNCRGRLRGEAPATNTDCDNIDCVFSKLLEGLEGVDGVHESCVVSNMVRRR